MLGGIQLGSNRRKFTEEETRILAANPYTYRITESTIRFTLEFKKEFYKRYKDGYSPMQIFSDLGYDINILGKRRVEGVRDHIMREAISDIGLHEGTVFSKKRLNSQDNTTLTPSKAIERLQHELLYLRQEVEFIKKIITADGGKGRKK